MIRSTRLAGAGLLLAVLAACDQNGGPLSPDARPSVPENIVALDCKVTVKPTASVGCTPSAPETGANPALIVGNQNVYVRLASSNLVFDAGTNLFSFDATVQNLLVQALGTVDGATLDPEGVQVFFHSGPTSTGAGSVTVHNATASGDFTGTDQPYFQYDQILAKDVVSNPKSWQFLVAGASEFVFKVYVRAAVQYPEGYVTLSLRADTLAASDTVRVTHTVHNAVNSLLADQAVTWSSSNTGVATVDAGGLITAVAPGTSIISAAQGSRTGQMTVAVCANLSVGGVYTATMPGASSLCFSGAAGAAAEYVYMPLNHSTSSALALSVTGTGIVPIVGPPSPSIARDPSFRQIDEPQLRAGDDWHMAHLRRQEREVAGLRGRPGALITRGARPGGADRLITKGPGAVVGDLMTLNTASGCAGARVDQIGRVVAVGQTVLLVADTMNPAGGFTTAQWDSIALEFDTLAHPVNVNNFGVPTDLDENGKVVAFYTRTVNLLTPPGSGSVVGGYVNARDLFSANPTGSCPRSNEGEIFYMRVPDPTGTTGNTATVASVRTGTVATLAHEFQHLINASRRIYLNGTWNGGLETVWLNEGISHIAEELMFYRAAGLTPRSNITLANINNTGDAAVNSRRVGAFNRYANQNFSRFRSWFQRPDTAGPMRNNDVLATRGAIWSFLRYAADRRNGNDAELWSNLVNTQTSGVANLQNAFGASPTEWARDWVAAVYADDVVPGLPAVNTTPSWNFRSVYGGLGGFSIGTRPLANGVANTFSMAPGSSTAYVRFGVPANAFAGVTALSGGAVPTSPYGFIVVRTK